MGAIISVNDVSMRFRMDVNHTSNLKEWFVRGLKRQNKYEDFYALRDVSIEIERGEVVGLIGHNGSGKSTLLKVICGIYKPSKGTAVAAGRIAPMLELGSGFDHELSGHDNIFLNGAIMGFTEKYLQSKYDEIVEFSELGDFINVPIKTYSSGMMMRLAFSVATIIEPEILIVDEILSVGDASFKQKSYKRMMQLMEGGTTVLFVSHDLDKVRELCNRVIWLDHGSVKKAGNTNELCDEYEMEMIGRIESRVNA